MVATNASGPRRIQAGAARDSLIGVRFVDGTGAVVKNGGRVMKNVTGLDLVKLLAGSHGTLGVVTEVAFKVLPRPGDHGTLVLDGLDDAAAGRAMTRALATPYQVSAAAHWPGAAGGPRTLLRLEGFAGSVAHRAQRARRALADFAPARLEEGAGDWAARPRRRPLRRPRRRRLARLGQADRRPRRSPPALPEAEVLYDWGGGLVWVLAPEETDLRAALAGLPGHATLVRASDAAKARHGVFHPEPPAVAALSKGLRARFDPKGILNPGRMARPEA